MGLGGGQDKDGVRRRFFQRLQQGVGGLLGEHVDFVDDIDLVAGLVRGVVHLLPQVADLVDAAVAGGVNLDNIERPPLGYLLAHRAGIARLPFASLVRQFTALARMRPVLVLPVPRGPQKR